MSKPIDVEPTAEVIDGLAENAERFARELRHIAATMRERQDIGYAMEAMQAIKNMNANFRTDLLVLRPIRALMGWT
jgi:hypothetical protein